MGEGQLSVRAAVIAFLVSTTAFGAPRIPVYLNNPYTQPPQFLPLPEGCSSAVNYNSVTHEWECAAVAVGGPFVLKSGADNPDMTGTLDINIASGSNAISLTTLGSRIYFGSTYFNGYSGGINTNGTFNVESFSGLGVYNGNVTLYADGLVTGSSGLQTLIQNNVGSDRMIGLKVSGTGGTIIGSSAGSSTNFALELAHTFGGGGNGAAITRTTLRRFLYNGNDQIFRATNAVTPTISWEYATSGGNDYAYIMFDETTADLGILKFNTGDDGAEQDSFYYGGNQLWGFRIAATGKLFWASPSATPSWDTDLFRAAADELESSASFFVSAGEDVCIRSGVCLSTRAGTHSLLSATHTDTAAAAGVNADLITFDTDHWERFPACETDDCVLFSGTSGGTQPRWEPVDDCDDTGGNHLNYDTTTNQFICGTSSGGGGASHNLLSATHSDTTAAAFARGALVVGGLTTWQRLTIGGAGTFLKSDGTDANWNNIAYADVSGTPTLRYQTVQDDSVDQTQRSKLNLKSGTNVTVTCADNAGADSSDCTIAASSGSGNSVEAEVDFGAAPGLTVKNKAVAAAWVLTTSRIVCVPTMFSTADRADGAEDAIIEQLHCAPKLVADGIGFTVSCHAPMMATGKFKVHCLGV